MAMIPGSSWRIEARDRAGHVAVLSSENVRPPETAAASSLPPTAVLCATTPGRVERFSRRSKILDGAFYCEERPATLWLNQTNQLDDMSFAWDAERKRVRYATPVRVELNRTNTYEVTARDSAGNDLAVHPHDPIYGTAPEFLSDRYRLGVSIPPLWISRKNIGFWPDMGTLTGMVTEVRARIQQHLQKRTPARFEHFSVRPDVLETVLAEKKLQRKDLLDPRTRIPFERIRKEADVWFAGNLIPHGNGYEIRLHIINTHLNTVHGYVDVYVDLADKEGDDLLREEALKIRALVDKVETRFPMVRGRITDIDRKANITIDQGNNTGVSEGNQFIVIVAGEHQVAEEGRILETRNRPFARLTLHKVEASVSRCRFMESVDLNLNNRKHFVVSR
ncbi:MAG: hypothetical protein AAF492_07590 [Verrucomicrobiota bacterium]